MKEYVSDTTKEMETLKVKIKGKFWVSKNNVTEMKTAFSGLSVDLTGPRKKLQ